MTYAFCGNKTTARQVPTNPLRLTTRILLDFT